MEEILHQLIGGLFHDLQGLIHHRCRISSINSMLVPWRVYHTWMVFCMVVRVLMVPLHPQTGRRAKRKAQRGSNREALQVGPAESRFGRSWCFM